MSPTTGLTAAGMRPSCQNGVPPRGAAMALSFPAIPKLSGRTVAVLVAVGALAVGAVAAAAAKNQPASQPPPGPSAGSAAVKATDDTSQGATLAEAKAAAALPQCRSARLVPVNKTWG